MKTFKEYFMITEGVQVINDMELKTLAEKKGVRVYKGTSDNEVFVIVNGEHKKFKGEDEAKDFVKGLRLPSK